MNPSADDLTTSLSQLSAVDLRAVISEVAISIPSSTPRRRESLLHYVTTQTSPGVQHALQAAAVKRANEQHTLKRRRQEHDAELRIRDSKMLRLDREASGYDAAKFLSLPTQEEIKALYTKFYRATSNAAVSMMVCGACAREIDVGITGEEDATPRRLRAVPNSHRLIPSQAHAAHDLFDRKLLDPAGVVEINGETHVRLCSDCSSSLAQPGDKPPKHSLANNMWIGKTPWQLQVLTFPEQLLVALIYPRVFVFKLHPRIGGRDPSKLQRGMRGTVSTYDLDTDGIASMLAGDLMPRPPAVLASVLSVTYIGVGKLPKNWLRSTFRVRRQVVYEALNWLKNNNPKYYGHIKIDGHRIAALPEDDVPLEISTLVRQSEDITVVERECDGYVREQHDDEHADGLDNAFDLSDDESETPQDTVDDAEGGPDVIPLTITGTVDTDLSSMSTNEMMHWGLANLWRTGEEGGYAVRHGSHPVSDFGRPPQGSTEPADPDRPNFFERAFPCLFPFGVGGPEADRTTDLSFTEHVRWALQYHDRRFRRHETFPFVAFGISQRRQALMSARIQMRRKDFEKDARILSTITQQALEKAKMEEDQKQRISDPAVRLLRQHVHSAVGRVQGSNESRTILRSQLWSTTLYTGPWNLWITINPSDIHDPIAQVFAGEHIDLDNFISTAGPDINQRGQNIAADPYAAAKFFHFTIRTILETLFGIKTSGFRVRSEMGIFGQLAAYFGMVEGQNRASLHFHLIAALRFAPNADEIQELLQREDFREKIRAYIRVNMRAYLPGLDSAEGVKDIAVEKEIAYNRPPNPDGPAYWERVQDFERRLARTEQVHTCDIRRCLVVTKSGRLRCKRRAPFPCSTDDYVLPNGDWGPKRLYEYINGWNPALLVNVRCNNDSKFLTHGDDTKKITLYILGYATKPQLRNHNTSAILAKGYAYHTATAALPDEQIKDLRDRQRLLLFRLVHAINREQELGAPMVISYLMGWGDCYKSHNYVPIYWTSFAAALRKAFPSLHQHKGLTDTFAKPTRESHIQSASAQTSERSLGRATDETEECDQMNVTLTMNTRGLIFAKNQVTDYVQRGDDLESYSVLDYFVETYEVAITQQEREAQMHSNARAGSGSRGRPKNTRIRYRPAHPTHEQKQRVMRAPGHDSLPNFIGEWFPRRNDVDQQDFYHASMLLLLKPWRCITEGLKRPDETWEEAFRHFAQSGPERNRDILANIQFYHSCQSAALASKDDEIDGDILGLAPSSMTEPSGGDEEMTVDAGITEDDISALQACRFSRREADHGDTAIEIARLVRLFNDEDGPWAIRTAGHRVAPASGDDLINVIRWKKQMDYLAQMQNTILGPSDEGEDTATVAVEGLDRTETVEMITSDMLPKGETTKSSHMFDVDSCDGETTGEEVIVLQPDQQRAYDIIMWHLGRVLAGHDVPPLRMLIHGEGGTGKSKVITKVTRSFQHHGVHQWLVKAAYTGVAASLIDGKTTHTIGAMGLRGGKISDANKAKLQTFWRERKYLIIDEISMISKQFLAQLSRNIGMGKASATDKSFGGLSVILCGDFHQFPPVATSASQALYYPMDIIKDNVDTKIGRAIYEEFSTVVLLKQQMRVTDQVWLDFLRHLRVGNVKEHHMSMLRTLCLSPDNNFEDDPWQDATLVTPRHGVRVPWNTQAVHKMCRHQARQLYICAASDTYRGAPLSVADRYALALHLSKGHAGNNMEKDLPHSIELAIGMSVMVTNNIETDLDLTNGARGTIEDIILDPDEPPIGPESVVHLKRLPAYILVRFERTRAAQLSGLPSGVLPIQPAKTTYLVKSWLSGGTSVNKTITRRQYPLTGAYAFTDYRSQGQTLKRVIVDIAMPPTGGLSLFNVYVALSRSSGRETIRLLRDFDNRTFQQSHDTKLLAEDDRLEDLNGATKRWWETMTVED
ncbi:unnamed protein product [Mycena citricolor]|uniref:ATP-dependent DNA helicase n=1 Tax=Mycena citricolor TaxID=2018698 RepID=A0AAD2H146_9AGAR|nr:unnamed protein product [Mycena citricolor]